MGYYNTGNAWIDGIMNNRVAMLDYSVPLGQQLQTQMQNYQNQQPINAQFAQALSNALTGQGPSVAQEQLNQSLAQNQNAVASQMASARGINPALAQELAVRQGGNMAQQAAGQGALLRAQELAGARQQALGLQQLQTDQTGQLLNAQAANLQTQAANDASQRQSDSSLVGGIIGGIGGIGASMIPKGKARGGAVLGQAKVAGDSPANDTVPAMLSPGEIVIPRTIAQDGDMAKAFVDAINEHRANGSYMNVLNAKYCYGGRVR